MTIYQYVLTDIAKHVGTLTLNRPDRMNAFEAVMSEELLDATRELVDSSEVRAIVITGNGRAFCAGADVRYMADALRDGRIADAQRLVQCGGDVVRLLRETPKPVLGAINGAAAGGGASLALACDLRLASDQASLGQVFHRIGLHPDMGSTYFLPQLVGPSRALELIWSAEMIDAGRCLELGLFNRVVPHASLHEATATWAARLAALPPIAAGLAKHAVYDSYRSDLSAALAFEYEAQAKCFQSEDAAEGIAAFTSKRVPTFRGR
ncbi:MAG: enoyl-CoA hydratase/isomerase family protein [Gemmatimonadota bacterium]